jgi:hypothetical protein
MSKEEPDVFVGELSAWLTACPEKKKREKTAYATQVRAAAAVDASSAFRAASRSQGTCGGEHVHFICRYMIDLCLARLASREGSAGSDEP